MERKEIQRRITGSERIVVKIGTSTLMQANGHHANLRRISKLCRVLSDLQNSGKDITLVSSGAIGVGLGKMGMQKRPAGTSKKQALAAIGQLELMFLYDKFFSEYNQKVAQILLMADDLKNPISRKNVMNTFDELNDLGVIPIVNENDTVATAELEGKKIGDNDTLSAQVASLIRADLLILLTDIDGMYDANPKEDPKAKLLSVIPEVTDQVKEMAGGTGTSLGTGGMITKVRAAEIAGQAGIPTCIMNGEDPENLYTLFDGDEIGTVFLPGERG